MKLFTGKALAAIRLRRWHSDTRRGTPEMRTMMLVKHREL
jgi:hypothetical protein